MMIKIIYKLQILLAMTACLAILSCCDGGAASLSDIPEAPATPAVPADPNALCAVIPNEVGIANVEVSETPLTRSASGEPEQKATFSANLGHNYSAEAVLEALPQEPQTRATVNLADGIQYRMVVFDSSNKEVGNVVYKVGSPDIVNGKAIKLQAGTYRLFCCSINSTTKVNALSGTSVTTEIGSDFMTYTDASFEIKPTDYGTGKKVNITFTRQCAKLTVTVKADGYSNNTITAASLTLGSVFGGEANWNCLTNTDASTLAYSNGTRALVKVSSNGASVDCGKDASTPHIFVAPFTNQTISVSNLKVTIPNNGDKTPANFNFPSKVTLTQGRSYRLTITVAGCYVLTSTNPVTIAGIKWARTNLQQTGSGISAPVSLVSDPWDYGSRWVWGKRDAAEIATVISDAPWTDASGSSQDPCRAYGPGWRLPTSDEFKNLIAKKAPVNTRVKISNSVETVNDYGWVFMYSVTDSPGASVYIDGGKVLLLPAAGYRDKPEGNGLVNQRISGNYWSSNSAGSLSGDYLYFYASGIRVTNPELDIVANWGFYGHSLRCLQ